MSQRPFPLRIQVRERTLSNGMHVLICEDRRASVAAVVTHVSAGYFDEPDAVAGISHVLEHMFFKGTSRRGPGDMARETKELGGYLNAGTIYDRTSYYAVVPARGIMQAIDIQADALCNSTIDADELARELRVIIQEAKRKLDSPAAVAREMLYETMFDAHRIRRWRIGTESTLERLSRDDVVAFYRGHYRGQSTVLCVTGDVDGDEVFDRIETAYAGLSAEPPRRDRGAGEPARSGFRFRDLSGDVRQTRLELGWRTVPLRHGDAPVLDMLAVVMGQGRGSRLYRCVREAGLVTSINASNYTPADLGVYGVGAITRRSDAERALDAITAVIDGLRAEPVAGAELERARNVVEARLIRRYETVEAQATSLAEWQAEGGWRMFETYWDAMFRVTPDDMRRVAEMYLDPADATALVYRADDDAPIDWSPAPARDARGTTPAAEPVEVFAGVTDVRAHHERTEDGVHFTRSGAVGIVTVPRRDVPLVSMALHYHGGGLDESESQAGLTALMLRSSIKGTARRTAAQLASQAELLGGSIATGLSADGFSWSLTIPSRHVERGIELMVDAATGATFPEDETDRERAAMLTEAEQQRDDMNTYPVRLFQEEAFRGDAYGTRLEDVEAVLRGADAVDVRTWHGKVVGERAPTLLVAGDIDPATSARLAGFLEGAGTATPPARSQPPWPADRRRNTVERHTAQTALALGMPGPAHGHPDTHALRVMAAAIGGLGGSLFEELRSRRSLAYTVSARLISWHRAGAFLAYIATSPEREDEARNGLVEQLLAVRTDRLDAGEIERAKNYLIGTRQIRLQTTAARLAEVAGAVLFGEGMAELREHEARVRAVTADSIRDAAARWLDEDRIVEGIVRGTGQSR